MPTQVPLINNTSFVTLNAPNSDFFYKTITFYSHVLGFNIHSENEEQTECWLSSSSLSSTSADLSTIQLKLDPANALDPEAIQTNIEYMISHKDKKDWRILHNSFVVEVDNLDDLISGFESKGIEHQCRPVDIQPFEVYVFDPLGTVIGFTAAANPFGVKVPKPTKKSTSSITATGTTTTGGTGISTPLNMNMGINLNFSSLPELNSDERRNIAVMTSGGDAPGMNANVRAIIRAAIYRGCKAFAVMEGYSGLVKGGPEMIKEMGWHDVRGWLAEGGTNIGTARCMEFKERWGRLAACKNMIDSGIDALIVCGGDGSLTGADLFRSEWPDLIKELLDTKKITEAQYLKHKHLNICGTVGSIDNDMSSTDATIGAYSSLARICQAIDYIDATANSHQRAFVIEVMGRHCGWLALMAGMATSADYIFIPEKPSSHKEWEDHMCKIVSQHRQRGKRKSIVIVAEGAITSDLAPISCNDVKDVLVNRLGLDTRVTTLGHVQRGGTAVAYDRHLATLQGVAAVDAVLKCTPETPSPMIAVVENKIVTKPLVEAVRLTKEVAKAINNKDFDRAISLRDSEFTENLSNFMSMNSADFVEPSLPLEKRLKIAIINVGAPAGGMNAAVASMALHCMSRGHTPYAIHNGFSGLARHESVRLINWLDIEGWVSLGGSEIGTNRITPEEADIGMIAYYFEKYKFDGLILVGGFEAFVSLNQLEKARMNYPSFRIPMVLIPATISNNVPGTEYSLGSDTCLNSLMEYCDSIKLSAAATRNRVFVVECQGGNCGYIASYAQLCCGAQASYVPEEGLPLAQLDHDVISLKESFMNDKGKARSGRILIKSEKASKTLSTKVIADIINLEGNERFDCKTAIPGHVQQGGIPSPIDRTRAARFSIRAIEFIESKRSVFDNLEMRISDSRATAAGAEAGIGGGSFVDDLNDLDVNIQDIQDTAVVLGIIRSHVRFNSIRKLYDNETEEGRRVRKSIFWKDVRDIANMLVGRTLV